MKTELIVPIHETELLDFLLGRYMAVKDKGISIENTVIRSITVEPNGKCLFRMSAVLPEVKPSEEVVRIKKL